VQFSHLQWAWTSFNHKNRRHYRGNEDVLNIKMRSGNAFGNALSWRYISGTQTISFCACSGSTDRLQYLRVCVRVGREIA
jgi:hypothetical protein